MIGAFFEAFLGIFAEAGVWLIVGFLVAGLLHAFVSRELLARHLGRGGFGSVLKATLIGVPMPLCSCSVIPAAASLRQSGASKGSSAAFAVSTPEIDVPAASLTWALLGPVMAIARVIASFVSAIVAGVLIDAGDKKSDSDRRRAPESALAGETTTCCAAQEKPKEHPSIRARIRSAVVYTFITLPADLVVWLLIGFAVSAAVTAFVPDTWLSGSLGSGIVAIALAMGLGLIVYVCATGSTPMAAALVAKGLGPGAALAFLLAGPATNPATMAWILKDLGARALAIYLASIAGVAVVSALALDWLVRGSGFTVTAEAGHAMGEASPLSALGGAALMAIMTYALVMKVARRFEREGDGASCCTTPEKVAGHACCANQSPAPKAGDCCG